MKIKRFTVISESGLYDMPMMDLVNKAATYESEIAISYKEKMVNLKSIMGVMALGVEEGGEVEIRVEGRDQEEAFNVISEMIEMYGKMS